jgi:hypothetical protein
MILDIAEDCAVKPSEVTTNWFTTNAGFFLIAFGLAMVFHEVLIQILKRR